MQMVFQVDIKLMRSLSFAKSMFDPLLLMLMAEVFLICYLMRYSMLEINEKKTILMNLYATEIISDYIKLLQARSKSLYMFYVLFLQNRFPINLIILRYIVQMIGLFTILCLTVSTFGVQVVVDYNKQPYTALRDVLGKSAIQNSDSCDDKLTHITVAKDPILNRNVFLYSLHVHNGYVDGDRCTGDYSRQRCETSVQGSSPAWMKGDAGKTFTYAWKVYLDPGFQVTGQFCHLHQIKLDGANVGNPNLTLTARADVQLQNQGEILAKVPLASFKGVWIQIREKITYGANGCIEFTAYRMKDGYLLMSHKGCGVKLNNNGVMIRPKFGFYRSLANSAGLRNESVRIVDLCLGEGDSCHYDQNGNKHSPAPEPNLSFDQE